MRDSFVMYTEYLDHLELMSMEQRGVLFTALLKYAAGDELPEMDGAVKMAFSFIKNRIDRDTEKYNEVCRKRSEAGKAGGRPKKANGFSEKQTEAKKANGFSEKQMKAKKADNEYDNDLKESTLTGTKEKASRFFPPTIDEVEEYCREKGYSLDCERFVDFYESKGWMVGKNKMKDWRAAVRNWARGQRLGGTAEPAQVKTKFSNFSDRDYDMSNLEEALLGVQIN